VEIRAIETVIAIADHRSFQGAAYALEVSLSSISQRVQALEQELGVTLFDRTVRPPRLTGDGTDFVVRGRELLSLWRELGSHASVIPGQGLLKVGAVHTAVAGGVATALGRLHQGKPDLFIQLQTGLTTELVGQLLTHTIDCAIVTEPAVIAAEMQFIPVAREELGVIAARDAVRSDYRETLLSNPYIRFNRQATLARQIDTELKMRDIAVTSTMEIATLDAVESLVRNGLGVSVVPIGKHVRALPENIRALPFCEPKFYRSLGVMARRDSPRQHLVDTLVDALKSEYRSGHGRPGSR